jgi:hypothetical protein
MENAKDLPVDKSYQIDWLLVGLIRSVEQRERDESIPATEKHIDLILNIGGMLISGELVSHNRWINEMGSDADSENGDAVTVTSEPASSDDTTSPSNDDTERRFIHLRQAKFYLGGNVIPGEGDGFLWRGKLASVDGFMEGTLVTRNASTKIKLEGVRINIR